MDHLSRFWGGNAGMHQHYHDLVEFPLLNLFSRTKEYKPRLQYPKKLHSTVLLVVKNHRVVTVNGIVIYCVYIYICCVYIYVVYIYIHVYTVVYI